MPVPAAASAPRLPATAGDRRTRRPGLEAADRDKPRYTEFLCDLTAAEVDAVEQRRLRGRLRFAKLPARRTLEQFVFTAQPSLDRRPLSG